MHLFTTGVILVAAYASGAAARPQYHQPYKRQGFVSNSTIAMSSPTAASTTTSSGSTLSSSSVITASSSSTSSSFSTASSSSSVNPPTAAQTVAVQGGTYTAMGCYIDSANTGYPLVNAVKVSTSSTSQQCLATCAQASANGAYEYSGVEGTDCFCSNQFTSSASQSPGSCGSMKRDVFHKRQSGGAITIYQFTPSNTTSTSSTTSSVSITTSSGSSTTSSGSSLSISTSQATTTTGSQSGTTSSSIGSTASSTTPSTTIPSTSTVATLSSTSSSQISTTSSASAPAKPTPNGPYYIVVSGDTLASLSQRYGIALAALEALNPQIVDPNFIFPGEFINLPSTNPATPPTSNNPSPNPSSTASYIVNSGDTLSSIAAAFGVPLSSLEAANPNIKNPNFITPGEIVNIPSVGVFTYNVAAGNTLFSIAQTFGLSLAALEAANPQIENFNLIFPGQVINIPR